jgi:Ring finger domain
MAVDLFFVGQHVYLIACHYYSSCNAPVGVAVSIILLSLFVQLLGVEIAATDRHRVFGQHLLIWGLVSSMIATYFGLACLIIVLTKSASCLPIATYNFDVMMILMYSFIYTLILIFVIVIVIKLWCQQKRLSEESTKMYEEYPKLLQPRFDIMAFMKLHELAIEKNPIKQQDIALLNDFCSSKFTGQGEEAHRNECVVCLSEFSVDEAVITHPKCAHLYHPDCLFGWFQKSKQEGKCPVCRALTRKELLNLIHERKQVPSFIPPSHSQPQPASRA